MRELSKARYADQILTHYITLTMKNSGLPVTNDTLADLNKIIQEAIQEAIDLAVKEALERVNHG